jgi:hypothetical protein
MASGLAWLDTSREDQRRMRELLGLFAETESRDELGIGQVRDAFSDLLFPGTSTLHTRARYLLIVPWCYQEAERRSHRGSSLAPRVEHNERRVIAALKSSGAEEGLIGRVAGVAVKTLPSTIYWGALARYRIRTTEDPGMGRSLQVAEADELADRMPGDWAPTLPAAPDGFPGVVDGGLELGPDEAAFLRDKIRLGAAGSLLVHLLDEGRCPQPDSAAPWLDPACRDAPSGPAEDLRHAERFSIAIHGAALLYNLLLAQRYEAAGYTHVEDPVERFEADLLGWSQQVMTLGGWDVWDRADMWTRVIAQNPRIGQNLRARGFIDTWLNAIVAGRAAAVLDDRSLHDLVRERERSVKRAQSRFANDKLLRTWSGGSGNRQLTFRWAQVRRILIDIHDGLESDDAPA